METNIETQESAGNNEERFGTNFLNHESHVFPTSTTTTPVQMDKYNATLNSSTLNGTNPDFDQFYFYKVSQIFITYIFVLSFRRFCSLYNVRKYTERQTSCTTKKILFFWIRK